MLYTKIKVFHLRKLYKKRKLQPVIYKKGLRLQFGLKILIECNLFRCLNICGAIILLKYFRVTYHDRCAFLAMLTRLYNYFSVLGPLSPEHTILARTTHASLSVVTMTVEKNQRLMIDARDEYDNKCSTQLSKLELEKKFELSVREVNIMVK